MVSSLAQLWNTHSLTLQKKSVQFGAHTHCDWRCDALFYAHVSALAVVVLTKKKNKTTLTLRHIQPSNQMGVINISDFFSFASMAMVLTRVRLITLEITLMNWNEMHAHQNTAHSHLKMKRFGRVTGEGGRERETANPAKCSTTATGFLNERINQIKIHHNSRDR